MHAPTTARQAALPFILITLFIDILGIGIVVPVLPALIKEFADGSTPLAGRYVGIIGASYSLTQFLCAPIMGALSDRFGRRPVLLAALFGLGVDYIIQGLAPNLGWLFVGRVFAGMMGGSISTANAYIADVSTAETRARNYGMVGVMFGLGFICGPALGGLLGSYNLRFPFFASATLALLNWLYGFFVLPESLPPEQQSNLTLSKLNPFGSLNRLRTYPIVAGLSLAFMCMSLAQRGLENVWVLFTGFQFGWDERQNGMALALVGFMAALVQGLLVKRFVSMFGERRTVMIGLSISVLAFFAYGCVTQGWVVPLIIMFGAFGGVTGPAIQSIVAGAVPPSEQGKIQGALTSLMSFTNILAPLLFTAGLFSYFTSPSAAVNLPGAPFLMGSLLLLTAWFVVRRVFRRIKEPESESADGGADPRMKPGC
jgi:DHA1 family tetracycline resistance protein-like MFS transporter